MVGSDMDVTLGNATIRQLLDELENRISAMETTIAADKKKPNTVTYEKGYGPRSDAQTHTFKD